MVQKCHARVGIFLLLREIDVNLHSGSDVVRAYRKVGILDKTYYYSRKQFDRVGRSKFAEMKALKEPNRRLARTVAELQLNKLILKESFDFFKVEGLSAD